MRDRILAAMTDAAERGDFTPSRWRELRDRMGDIAVSTIDAFCLSLLREYPLEADLDPGFSVADDAEVPRLMEKRSTAPCAPAARWRRTTRTSASCSRSWATGACGWAWAACSSGGWSRPPRWAATCRRARRVDGADGGRPGRRVAGALMRALPGGFEQFSSHRPAPPRVHAAAAAPGGILAAAPGGTDPAAVHDAYRAGAQVLPDAGRQAAARPPNTQASSPARSTGSITSRSSPTTRRAGAGLHRLSARPQPAGLARRLAHVPGGRARVPGHARRPRRAGLRRPAALHAAAARARWRSSRRAATGWSRATSTCCSTSSRTPAGRSGIWWPCSSSHGARAWALCTRGRWSLRCSSSATASSRSTASAMPTCRCSPMPAAISRDCGRAPTCGARSPAVSAR